jgi:CheY-like chemotaxis protein
MRPPMPDQRPEPRGVAQQGAGPEGTTPTVDLDTLSHELRTPLTPILAALHVLRDDPRLPSSLLPYVEIIQRNMEGQARLIDDLLDLNRLMRGQLAMALAPVDLNRVVDEVCEAARDEAAKKRLSVDVHLGAVRPLVRADVVRLRQGLANVLQNAVKFTPDAGTISIITRDGSGVAEIEIKDSGVGIERDQLGGVFEAFTRPAGQSRRLGGVGLGLALTHGIVRLHGGSVTVDSPGRGGGTRVLVRLPVTGDAGAMAQPQATAQKQQINILLVDDHDDTLMLMKMMLERRGYAVHAVMSAGEAVEVARQRRFDLLISDINLPDGNGLDVFREIRGLGTSRAIALSGFGRDADVRRSREAGFLEHLVKPVNMQKLHEVIQRVLG